MVTILSTKRDYYEVLGVDKNADEQALKKAHEEYDKYMKTHLTQAEKDYLEIMGEDIKKLNESGVEGIVIGSALYKKKINLKEALKYQQR